MLMGGLEQTTSGKVMALGHDLTTMSEDALARLRRDHFGVVFQSFHRSPTMTAIENVAAPLELAGVADAYDRAAAELQSVGLAQRMGHYPSQMSGGEQQRVAIARALINKPDLLIADEPTGNVDPEMARKILRLFAELNKRVGTTILIATHDLEVLREFESPVLRLSNGLLGRDVEYGADA